jgi:small-conductance mechanosensitive channel
MKPTIILIFILVAINPLLFVAMIVYWVRVQFKILKLLRYLRKTYPNKFRFDLLSVTMTIHMDMLERANRESLYDANAEAVRDKLRKDLRSPFFERAMSAVFVVVGLIVVIGVIDSRQWIMIVALVPVSLIGLGVVALFHAMKKHLASKIG